MTLRNTSGNLPGGDAAGLVHEACLYRSMDQYRQVIGDFVQAAVAAEEPTLVAVPGERLDTVREHVGPAADGLVHWVDMREAGANPGRILPALTQFAAEHPGPVRLVGEPAFAERTPAEQAAVAEHEALVNAAFAGHPVHALCPYDATDLDPAVLADARRTHPVLTGGEDRAPGHDFDPQAVLDRVQQPETPPEDAYGYVVKDVEDLTGVRRFAAGVARLLHLPEEKIAPLELIVTELASNSLRHAHAAATVQLWPQDDALVCRVDDIGHLPDALAGHTYVTPDRLTGRGLLLVQEFADLVRISPTADGTTVQVTLRREPTR